VKEQSGLAMPCIHTFHSLAQLPGNVPHLLQVIRLIVIVLLYTTQHTTHYTMVQTPRHKHPVDFTGR